MDPYFPFDNESTEYLAYALEETGGDLWSLWDLNAAGERDYGYLKGEVKGNGQGDSDEIATDPPELEVRREAVYSHLFLKLNCFYVYEGPTDGHPVVWPLHAGQLLAAVEEGRQREALPRAVAHHIQVHHALHQRHGPVYRGNGQQL